MKRLALQQRQLSSSLLRFGLSTHNTLLSALTAENDIGEGKKPSTQTPRHMSNAHFTFVCPDPIISPKLVHSTPAVARMVGIDPSDLSIDTFTQAVSGNVFLPGLDSGYATVYGCHSHGQWLGQLGDGRAISLGEVISPRSSCRVHHKHQCEHRLEIQLKGAGKTPYSRGYDGRAVLRSCVRELLASEAMHHLGVGSTRALAVTAAGGGQRVRRKWYGDEDVDIGSDMLRSGEVGGEWIGRRPNDSPHPPREVKQETVAVLSRVASSFFRCSHIELFAKQVEREKSDKGGGQRLVRLVNHILQREFPSLISSEEDAERVKSGKALPPERYINLFQEIVRVSMRLVTEWARVGYCQGNMNSDNIHVAGLTLDYGPFGWMEQYIPSFQPFTADSAAKGYSFEHQAAAMRVNMTTLGESIALLVRTACRGQDERAGEAYSPADIERYLYEVEVISTRGVLQEYARNFERIVQQKLGVGEFGEELYALWIDLDKLMMESGADYTMLFRSLGAVVEGSRSGKEALEVVRHAFYDDSVLLKTRCEGDREVPLHVAWTNWFDSYAALLRRDITPWLACPHDRAAYIRSNNPKYVLRNWMAYLAYEQAEAQHQRAQGEDYEHERERERASLVAELAELLEKPYEEGTSEQQQKWYRKTPGWAQGKPGVAFMSCSS